MVTDCGSLPRLGAYLAARLDEHFPPDEAHVRQALCLAEECGEYVAAFRRWKGMARRTGTFEAMAAELADVVLVAFTSAQQLGIDLEAEVAAKVTVIQSRAWRESA